MGGKKGGEGMCTVQKDYLQGRGKKGKAKEDDDENPYIKGKIFDSSGRKVLDRGEYKEFKFCGHCKNMMVWRKAWERCWDDVKFCSDKCRKLSKNRSAPQDAAKAAALTEIAKDSCVVSHEKGNNKLVHGGLDDVEAKMEGMDLAKTRAEFQKRFVKAADEDN